MGLLLICVCLEHGMHSNLSNKEKSLVAANNMKYQAQFHEHLAVQHKYRGFLCHVKGIALHNHALALEQKVEGEEIALEQEEHVVQEYKELFEKAEQAIQQCEALIREDEDASQQAHEEARLFLDEMYDMESQFAQVCADYHVSESMCETVARFKGLDHREKSLALDAISKEEEAFSKEKQEERQEEMELKLEKNATYYGEMEHEAKVNATRLEHAYQRDEEREESMEGSSATLLHQSDEEREMAKREDERARQAHDEAIRLFQAARVHARKSRWCAVFAVVATLAVFWVFVDYFTLLMKNRRYIETKSMMNQNDASTVALSEASEESPLMAEHDASSAVELQSKNESSSYDSSYVTIDLASRSHPGTTSSLSSNNSGPLSQIRKAAMTRIQQFSPTIKRWAPTMELVIVAAVALFAAHLLLVEIFPGLHKV
jgi:hypothetical protein